MIVCFKKKNVCSVKPQRTRSRDGQNSFLNGNRFFVFKRKKNYFFQFFVFKRKRVYQFFFKTIFSNVIRFENFKTIKKKVCLGKNVSFKSKTISKMDSQKGKRSFCKKIENDAHEVGRRNSSLFIRVEFVLFRFYA